MTQLFTQKGYWNGEHATFTACIIKPKECKEKPMYWYNAFAGTERQAIEITYKGETWLIDNNVGDGYEKVTVGMGSPSYGHKSIGEYDFVRFIPESEMNTEYNRVLDSQENVTIKEHQKTADPKEYERVERLLAEARKFSKMTPAEQVKHINDNMIKKP